MKYEYNVQVTTRPHFRTIYAENISEAHSVVENMFLGHSFKHGSVVATLERANGSSRTHRLIWGEGWEAV